MKLNKYIVSLSVIAIFGVVFAFSNIAFAQVPPTPIPVVTPTTIVPTIPPIPISTPIKLTSPMSGQLTPGQSINITWTGGDASAPIRISLIKVSPFKVYTVITDTAQNTGSYIWTIPANVPDNTYQFYVQSNRGKPGSTWMYGGRVAILNCSSSIPKIIIMSPTASDTFKAGNIMTVMWSWCNIPDTSGIGNNFSRIVNGLKTPSAQTNFTSNYNTDPYVPTNYHITSDGGSYNLVISPENATGKYQITESSNGIGGAQISQESEIFTITDKDCKLNSSNPQIWVYPPAFKSSDGTTPTDHNFYFKTCNIQQGITGTATLINQTTNQKIIFNSSINLDDGYFHLQSYGLTIPAGIYVMQLDNGTVSGSSNAFTTH